MCYAGVGGGVDHVEGGVGHTGVGWGGSCRDGVGWSCRVGGWGGSCRGWGCAMLGWGWGGSCRGGWGGVCYAGGGVGWGHVGVGWVVEDLQKNHVKVVNFEFSMTDPPPL